MSRARIVSATAFAVAAVLFGLVVVAALITGGIGTVWSVLLVMSPVSFAVPAAFVGMLAGPVLRRASHATAVVMIGAVATLAAASLYTVGWIAFFALGDIASGQWSAETAFEGADLFALAVFAIGLVASPFGALGAYAAWQWMRRGAPMDPA